MEIGDETFELKGLGEESFNILEGRPTQQLVKSVSVPEEQIQ